MVETKATIKATAGVAATVDQTVESPLVDMSITKPPVGMSTTHRQALAHHTPTLAVSLMAAEPTRMPELRLHRVAVDHRTAKPLNATAKRDSISVPQ